MKTTFLYQYKDTNKNNQYMTNQEESVNIICHFHNLTHIGLKDGKHGTFLFQVGLPVNRSKKRTLEELFKPPLDLMWQVIFSKYTENVYKGSSIYYVITVGRVQYMIKYS